jgi:putative ABC transport system substrate-binding protein
MPLSAQETKRRPIVAVLSPETSDTEHPLSDLTRLLAELGDVDGKNIDIQFRFADRNYQRLPKLAADLVAFPPSSTPTQRRAAGPPLPLPRQSQL